MDQNHIIWFILILFCLLKIVFQLLIKYVYILYVLDIHERIEYFILRKIPLEYIYNLQIVFFLVKVIFLYFYSEVE
jgi:hypothetical protein